jgi:hypothetical protein
MIRLKQLLIILLGCIILHSCTPQSQETPVLSKYCGLKGYNRDRKPGSVYCKNHSEELRETR